ncbi:MAG: Nif3-like dinuclear metal center hexameric protein [Desulfovibrio sp.]|jgi:dinuclear metal center YbgI/SA1388 family protein|nr:Nif3-like dinuclear metal center hexameric protein [Desulfovibrio sp.]
MRILELISIVERYAPPEAAASWDVSGIQVASFAADCSSVAVTLEPDPEILRAAADAGADFILTHHPLSMQPRFPNRANAYLAVLSLLCARGIPLYSAHTSLDANPKGPAQSLARELNLQDAEVLEPYADRPGSEQVFGFGFCGRLPETLAYADFCRRLGKIIDPGAGRVCGPVPARVSRLACCPGAGASLIPRAAAAGVDLFITGDIRYHSALEACELGLCVLDVGHFVLEEMMMNRFAALLARVLPVPVRFFPGRDPFSPARMTNAPTVSGMNHLGLEDYLEPLLKTD